MVGAGPARSGTGRGSDTPARSARRRTDMLATSRWARMNSPSSASRSRAPGGDRRRRAGHPGALERRRRPVPAASRYRRTSSSVSSSSSAKTLVPLGRHPPLEVVERVDERGELAGFELGQPAEPVLGAQPVELDSRSGCSLKSSAGRGGRSTRPAAGRRARRAGRRRASRSGSRPGAPRQLGPGEVGPRLGDPPHVRDDVVELLQFARGGHAARRARAAPGSVGPVTRHRPTPAAGRRPRRSARRPCDSAAARR